MAISIPSYKFRGLTISGAYARLEHASGGKHAGGQWRGLFKVYQSAKAANPDEVQVGVDADEKPIMRAPEPVFIEEIAVTADWKAGETAEAALYAALKKDDRAPSATDV